MLGVEKFGIDVLRGYKVATDDEDFGRDVTAKRSDSARGLIRESHTEKREVWLLLQT